MSIKLIRLNTADCLNNFEASRNEYLKKEFPSFCTFSRVPLLAQESIIIMKSYKSISSFKASVGKVLIVKNDVYRNTFDFKDIYPEVIIDGVKYKVKGIERYARAYLNEGDPLGILIHD